MTHSEAPHILVVEFDEARIERLRRELPRYDFTPTIVASADEGMERLSEQSFAAVVSRLHLAGLNGVGLAERVRANYEVPVILVSEDDRVEAALAALRAGVYDLLLAPFSVESLAVSLTRALRDRRAARELQRLDDPGELQRGAVSMIGESPTMLRAKDLVRRVAPTDLSVLISGESGTGKELVARALHELSPRSEAPFVAINCSAVPAQLLESELFGHEKGAFTGAESRREGLLVQASGGTLFLDEIGDMPLEMQAKLLRAVEERTVRPVGGADEVAFDSRIVAASNRDLESEIEEGTFREDLYYRLNVVHIALPPLRARGSDALLLAQAFIRVQAERLGRDVQGLSAQAAERILRHDWPGNVRELANCIERAVALTRFSEITVEDLPEKIRAYQTPDLAKHTTTEMISLEELERHHIQHVLGSVGGNKTRAAHILGIDRRTLHRKVERYGIGN